MNPELKKRFFDLFIAIPAAIIFCPIMLCISGLIHVTMGKPVIFRQKRPGLHGKPFTIYKFRTMITCCDGNGYSLPDSVRLTPLGKLLRYSSLDELPGLFNVIKGDMSLVGPRPLMMEYLDRYSPEHARRHDVKPGITGWAQIHRRQEIPFSKRILLDLWYIDNRSLGLDLKILFLSVWNVLTAQGVKLGQDVEEVDDLGLSKELVRTKGGREEE